MDCKGRETSTPEREDITRIMKSLDKSTICPDAKGSQDELIVETIKSQIKMT